MIASYQGHQVNVLDEFEMGGALLVAIEALEGKPFVGGDKWPVWTSFTTVRASELETTDKPKESKGGVSGNT